MSVKLDGKDEAEKLKKRIKYQISDIRVNTRPTLSVILVGNNSASETYVKIKKRFGETIGVKVDVYNVDSRNVRKTETLNANLRRLILRLNRSKNVHGVLLQLPLPKGFRAQEYINLIDRRKDVDGLRVDSSVRSPVAETVKRLLRIAINKHKKRSRIQRGVLLVKSAEFARSVLTSLKRFPVQWTTERVLDKDAIHSLSIKQYDIVVSALGFPHVVRPDMIKRGSTIIDVGFTKDKHGVQGDFHPDCYAASAYYSPVPGGVGPMTVAYLFKNLLLLWKQ